MTDLSSFATSRLCVKKCLTQSRQDARKTSWRSKVIPDSQERKGSLRDNGARMALETGCATYPSGGIRPGGTQNSTNAHLKKVVQPESAVEMGQRLGTRHVEQWKG